MGLITDPTTLEFVLSTTDKSTLVVSTHTVPHTVSELEKLNRNKNVNTQTFDSSSSPSFNLETDTNSGITNILIVHHDLKSAVEAALRTPVKTVLVTTETVGYINSVVRGESVAVTQFNVKGEDSGLDQDSSDGDAQVVLLQKRRIRLKEIVKDEEAFLSEVTSGSEVELLPNDHVYLLPPPPHYVSRRFASLRRLITPDVFTHGSDDVFVVTGATEESLKTAFRTRKMITVDSYEGQMEKGAVDVKLVAIGEHCTNEMEAFHKLRKLTNAPLHLLHVHSSDSDDSPQFDWVYSRGSSRLVEHYRDMRGDTCLDEDGIMPHSNSTTHVSIRVSGRGNGTDALVNSLSWRLWKQFPNRVVLRYGVNRLLDLMPGFVAAIEDGDEEEDEDGMGEFLEHFDQPGRNLLHHLMKSSDRVGVELVVSDWEKVAPGRVATALEVVKRMSTRWSGVRIWSFSIESLQPISFYRGLEESLSRIWSLGLVPLPLDDQVELAKRWPGSSDLVANVYRAAALSVSKFIGREEEEEDEACVFTGSPFQAIELVKMCVELVQGDDEELFGDEERALVNIPPGCILFVALCHHVFSERMAEYFANNSINFYGNSAMARRFERVHQYYAMKKLIPPSYQMLSLVCPEAGDVPLSEVSRYGIVTGFSKGSRGTGVEASFNHVAYAEYFCWVFIVEEGLTSSVLQSVGEMLTAPNLVQGIQSAGKFVFAGMLDEAVRSKGLNVLDSLVQLRSKSSEIIPSYVSRGGGKGLNSFKMVVNTVERRFSSRKLSEDVREAAAGVFSGAATTEENRMVPVLVDLTAAGCFPAVKFLVLEKGFGAGFWETHEWVAGRFVAAALSKIEDHHDPEYAVAGRSDILKLLAVIDKEVCKSAFLERFREIPWFEVVDIFHVPMLPLFQNEFSADPSMFSRVDSQGSTVLHALAQRADLDHSPFVHWVVTEGLCDFREGSGSSSVVQVGLEAANWAFLVSLADALFGEARDEAVLIYKAVVDQCGEDWKGRAELEGRLVDIGVLEGRYRQRNNSVLEKRDGEEDVVDAALVKTGKAAILENGAATIQEIKKNKKKRKKWYRPFC